VLKRAATKGLPGDHHFFISFKTKAAGVAGPPDLLGQHPDEMKIVLQHQFWDLAPGETSFSVTLRFGGQPKTLTVPYAAITQFWDPVADYRLFFTVSETTEAAPAAVLAAKPAPKPTTEAKAAPEKAGDEPKIVSLDQFRKK
jgi:hypothetical protein